MRLQFFGATDCFGQGRVAHFSFFSHFDKLLVSAGVWECSADMFLTTDEEEGWVSVDPIKEPT